MDKELIDIPQEAKDFAIEFSLLCKKHNLGAGTCEFRPDWDQWDNWWGNFKVIWNEGRHGEEKDRVHIETTMTRKLILEDTGE